MSEHESRTPSIDGHSPERQQESVTEVLEIFAKAGDLVDALDDGPKHKPELAEKLGVSKSTVYHWISDLTDFEFVSRTGDGFALTATGRLHARLYDQFGTLSDKARRAEPVLSSLPAGRDLPVSVLEDGTVITQIRDPSALRSQFASEIHERNVDFLSGVSPMVFSPFVDEMTDYLHDNDVSIRFVIGSSDVGYLLDRHREFCVAVRADPESALYERSEPFPFATLVLDGERPQVRITGCGRDPYPSGFVTSTAPAAFDWARAVCREFREDADRIDLDEIL